MRKLFTLATIAVLIATPAIANPTLAPNSIACLSEDLANQFGKSLYDHDMASMSYLLENGCLMSDKPLKVTVLELSSWGVYAHVRVYRGRHAAEVWTARQNLIGYDPVQP